MALTRSSEARVSSYSKRKMHFLRKRDYAAAFARADLDNVASQLSDCQETEVLAACNACGKSWFVPEKCRLRVCPLCSYEVSLKRAEYLQRMTSAMKHPKMLTLTMPIWEGDPREGIAHLRKCWNRLKGSKVFSKVVGGAYQIELKPKANGWHIHIHALLDAPFIHYRAIFRRWSDITGVAVPQVDIRSAPTQQEQAYVCKYASKAADFRADPDRVVQWYLATKGLRLFATFGTWYNVKLEELPNEGKLEEFVACCPFCKSEHTTFMARDGPFLYDPREWAEMSHLFIGDLPLTKDYDDIKTRIKTDLEDRRKTRALTHNQTELP